MIGCNTIKVTTIIKKLVHFTLFGGFIIMSAIALKDFVSFKTTLMISKEAQEITYLPSFSICPNFFTNTSCLYSTQLANGAIGNGVPQLPFLVDFETRIDDQWTNMLNENEMKKITMERFDSLWTFHCRPNPESCNGGCFPCITFNGATFKKAKINLALTHMKMNSSDKFVFNDIVVALHGHKQSMLLEEQFDWNHAFLMFFKNQSKIQTWKMLEMTEKKHISKCSEDQEYYPDDVEMDLVSKKINCSVPWSRLKTSNLKPCRSKNQFENYLQALKEIQMEEIPLKCKYKTWSAMPYMEQVHPIDSKNQAGIHLVLVMPKKQIVQIEEEVYMYPFEYLIGIFGGYLGLFLGGSILGIFEYLEQRISNIP